MCVTLRVLRVIINPLGLERNMFKLGIEISALIICRIATRLATWMLSKPLQPRFNRQQSGGSDNRGMYVERFLLSKHAQ